MPNDISRTSMPNELAILTELMLGHHIVKLDQFFIIFFFSISLSIFGFLLLFYSSFFLFFFTINS